MGNIRHPVDVAVEDLGFMRFELVSDFMQDDGCICEKEAGILIQFDEAVKRLRRARGIERGIELLVKQEGKPTRYTSELFQSIGVRLEVDPPLDAA